MAGTSSNLLPFLVQLTLQRAKPQPLPSNQVITQVAGPYAGVQAGDQAATTLWPVDQMVWGGPGVEPNWAWNESGVWN